MTMHTPIPSLTDEICILLLSQDPRVIRDAYALAELARARQHTAAVVLLPMQLPVERLLLADGAARPLLLLLGVSEDTIPRGLDLAQSLRPVWGSPLLLFGRCLNAASRRQSFTPRDVSGVLVGDPLPILDLLLRLLDGETLPAVPGLDRLDGSFQPRPPAPSGDPFPFPRFSGADLPRLRRQGLPIRFSQGCPRRCLFCAEQPREGPYRLRSPGAVLEEITYHWHEHDIRRFHFVDLVLNGDPQQLARLCQLLLQSSLEPLWWGRALVDPDAPFSFYRLLRQAGCISLELEVISGSDTVLRRQQAGFTAAQAGRALELARTAGIQTLIALDVGLPGEREQEYQETLTWLFQVRHDIAQVRSIRPFELRPASRLWQESAQHHLVLPALDAQRQWHDGGFNNASFRLKQARQLRLYVEEKLSLHLLEAPAVPWPQEQREEIQERLWQLAQQGLRQTVAYRQTQQELRVIRDGVQVPAGPQMLELDLTNSCNLHCAGCWTHSLLLGPDRLRGPKRQAHLSFDVLRRLLGDAKEMGVRQIQISGAGEPFMYPHIDEALQLVKELGFRLSLISNGTLIDEGRARQLVDLGVEALTVSLWAGTAATYRKTHPQASADQFPRLVEAVQGLSAYRRRSGARYPRIKIFNVISRLNCHEIQAMIDTAQQMGADFIELTPIDIIPGKTDELALREEDIKRLGDQLLDLPQRDDYLQYQPHALGAGKLLLGEEQEEFGRFLARQLLPGDFSFAVRAIPSWNARCRRGLSNYTFFAENQRECAVLFFFRQVDCAPCQANLDCSIDPILNCVAAPYLSVQGLGSFWRRVSTNSAASQDRLVVDQIPCYIGYTYSRVQATGDVIPCCKAATFSLGNLNQCSFAEIWSSVAYQEFRHRAMHLPKSDPYFQSMNCAAICDNLGLNLNLHQTIRQLDPADK